MNLASHFHPLYLRVGLQEEVGSARVCLNNYALSEKLLRSTPFSQDKSRQFQGNLHSPSYLHKMEAGEEDTRQRASKHSAPVPAPPPSTSAVSIAHKSGGSIHPHICSPHIQSLPSKSFFLLQTTDFSNLGESALKSFLLGWRRF